MSQTHKAYYKSFKKILRSGIEYFSDLRFLFQEYSVQITFRQKWNDDRLSYDQRLSLGDMRCKWITSNKSF